MSLCLTPVIPAWFKGMKKMVVEHYKDQKQPKSRLVRTDPAVSLERFGWSSRWMSGSRGSGGDGAQRLLDPSGKRGARQARGRRRAAAARGAVRAAERAAPGPSREPPSYPPRLAFPRARNLTRAEPRCRSRGAADPERDGAGARAAG